MQKAARTTADMARLVMFVVMLLEVVSMTSATTCGHEQKIELGKTYHVKSPKYPEVDRSEVDCRWFLNSTQDSVININCTVNITQTEDCTADYLTVALSGDLQDVEHRYCGDRNFLLTSNDSAVAFEFVVGSSEHGSRFLCTIIAVSTQDPTCDCGRSQSQPRIVGVNFTGVNEYPMMAGLRHDELEIPFCGATIISTRFVVTAAHCILESFQENVKVVVGEHDTRTREDTSATQVHLIASWNVHPEYNNTDYRNDIALVQLSSEIVFNKDVGPACLPIRLHADTFEDQFVTVLGWGRTHYESRQSPLLKQAQLKVKGRKDCNDQFQITFNVRNLTDNEMCTMTYYGHDAICKGDSGGPVLWQDPDTGRLHLIGIISLTIRCTWEYPSINVRVGAYIDWIKTVTNKSDYCIK